MAGKVALVQGYASLFGLRDGSGDVVERGAFARSLAARRTDGIRFLFQHDPAQPIGRWTHIRETATGLWCSGEINLNVARGRELAELVASDAIDGLSIGFRTVAASKPRSGSGRILRQIDLWEISLVTFPMLASARISRISWPGTPADTQPGAMEATGDITARMARAANLLDMSNQ